MTETTAPRSLLAPAKINLSLEIVGRRTDGYHDLVSVMQSVDLCDRIDIRTSAGIAVTCSMPELQNGNLVERVATELRQRRGVTGGAKIHVDKSIPVGGGLGGGSSDAASALLALNLMWALDLTCAEMTEIAAAVGSDVPYFLTGGLALVEGRGEIVHRIPGRAEPWYVLVNPGFHVSTADVFRALRRGEWTHGELTRDLVRSLGTGESRSLAPNTLEGALSRAHPEAARAMALVRDRAPNARLSGSGPTMFIPCASRDEAETAVSNLATTAYWTRIARARTESPPESPCTKP